MSKSQKGKNQHVVPHPEGWAVKSEGAGRATRVTETQQEAMDIAREIAKNQGSERIVHGENGRIRQKNSYDSAKIKLSPRKRRLLMDRLFAKLNKVDREDFENKDKNIGKREFKQFFIANLLYQSKQKQLSKFLILGGLSAISVALSMTFGILPVEPKLIALFSIASLLPSIIFWFRNQTIKYRISRGYYGNNQSEARELIEFIESMADDIPPSDGDDGGIKAFPDEVVKNEEPVIDGGLVGEGA